jgi:hypothetical protein
VDSFLTTHLVAPPRQFFSFLMESPSRPLSRAALREASTRSTDRVTAWTRDNMLPPLEEVRITLQEIVDAGSAVFGPSKIVLSHLAELVPGCPPRMELRRLRKRLLVLSLLRAVVIAQGQNPATEPRLNCNSSLPVSASAVPVPPGPALGVLAASGAHCMTEGCMGLAMAGFPMCRRCAETAAVASFPPPPQGGMLVGPNPR